MKEITMGWKGFLARVLVLCLALGVTMRVALARDGEPGGRARSFVSIAGTVTGVAAGEPMMRFTFRHRGPGDGGVPEVACERMVPTTVAASGEFVAEVPREPFTPECPEGMFDGRDVYVDVSIGGVTVVERSPVNQVPYAVHADTAAAATPNSGLERQLATAAASVPPGTIVAFGGERVPDGWLPCDGREVARTGAYNALFVAIGTAWGAGDGGATFHLPDLRARFLRGVDGDAGVDPDRAARVALRAGGNVGDRVATYQASAFQSHTHVIDVMGGLGNGRGTQHVAVGLQDSARNLQPLAEALTDPSGRGETRPVNAAVHYIIRY